MNNRYFKLTYDVIIFVLLKFQAPEIRAEFLKFDGKLNILIWLGTVEQRCIVLSNSTAICLVFINHVDLIIFILANSFRVHLWAYNIQFVSYLWIQYQSLSRKEPKEKKRKEKKKKERKKGKCETLDKISFRKVAIKMDRKEQIHSLQNQNDRVNKPDLNSLGLTQYQQDVNLDLRNYRWIDGFYSQSSLFWELQKVLYLWQAPQFLPHLAIRSSHCSI